MPEAKISRESCAQLGYTVPHVCTECPGNNPVQHKIFEDADTKTTVYHAYWNKPAAPTAAPQRRISKARALHKAERRARLAAARDILLIL